MSSLIQIKGIKEGLLITLAEGDWSEIYKTLLNHLDDQIEFMRGARIAIDVGSHDLRVKDISNLRSDTLERDLSLWALLSSSNQTMNNAQSLGLATRISQTSTKTTEQKSDSPDQNNENALLIKRTLRSGNRLSFPGHITVIGDINPGAEVIASGNIIVWGRLSGLVHAGAEGDENAVVCALDFSPTQIRIAGQIANISTHRRRGKPIPEMAFKENDQVIKQPWKSKKRI